MSRPDVAIIGAGIAGVATAFFVLRSTSSSVLLIERDRVARGATGRNAGQLTTYFERPLYDIADEFGDRAGGRGSAGVRRRPRPARPHGRRDGRDRPRRAFHRSHGDVQAGPRAGPPAQQPLRRQGGWRTGGCVVSEDAAFLTRSRPSSRRSTTSSRRRASGNSSRSTTTATARCSPTARAAPTAPCSASRCSPIWSARYPDRFRFADQHRRRARHRRRGRRRPARASHRHAAQRRALHERLRRPCRRGRRRDAHPTPRTSRSSARFGYMAAFVEDQPRTPAAMSYIRNQAIGGGEAPYVYVTRRTYDRPERRRDAHLHGRAGVAVRPRRLRPVGAVSRRAARRHGFRGARLRPARAARPGSPTTSTGTG